VPFSALFRQNSKSDPWNWFVPDFVNTLNDARRKSPYSAL